MRSLLACLTITALLQCVRNAVAQDLPYESVELRMWELTANDNSSSAGAVQTPSTVFGGLVDFGTIPDDPFYGLNLQKVSPKSFEVSWTYKTSVDLLPRKNFTAAFLEIQGINYRAKAYVNGKLLKPWKSESPELVGTYRHFRLPIPNELLQAQVLYINIEVTKPVDDWSPPGNNSTDLAISFLDWNPPPPDASMGILRPVHLLLYASPNDDKSASLPIVRAENLLVNSAVDVEKKQANVSIGVDLTDVSPSAVNASASSAFVVVECAVTGNGGFYTSALVTAIAYGTAIVGPITIEGDDLELWWPWHMLPTDKELPTLYNVSCNVSDGSGRGDGQGALLDVVAGQFGIREVTSKLDSNGYLSMQVNGADMLVLGGGYTTRLDSKVCAHSSA